MTYQTDNIELTTGYAEGVDGWGDNMNLALLLFSALVQAGVVGRVLQADLPAAPDPGVAYIVTDGDNANKVAIRTDSDWVYVQAKRGWRVFDRDTSELLLFDAGWNVFAPGSDGGGGGGTELPPYDGNAGKHLAVTAGEDGVEWVTPESGGGGGGGGDLPASWSFGAGDRRTLIGVTCTGGNSGNPVNSLHSGRINDFYFDAGAATKVLRFDFRKPVLVQGFATIMDTQASNGTWTIAGSNDAATWTDIINDYTMGGAPYGPVIGVDRDGRTYVREFANETLYRYIRLTLNAGQTTNNSNYVQQFFFKQSPL